MTAGARSLLGGWHGQVNKGPLVLCSAVLDLAPSHRQAAVFQAHWAVLAGDLG